MATILPGTNGNDSLYGGGSTAFLELGSGNDSLDGGSGNDSLSGGDDNDTLYGGDGSDSILSCRLVSNKPLKGRMSRVEVALDEFLPAEIDATAKEIGSDRSTFLAAAAEHRLLTRSAGRARSEAITHAEERRTPGRARGCGVPEDRSLCRFQIEYLSNAARKRIHVLCLALPNDLNSPSQSHKIPGNSPISIDISVEFFFPKPCTRFREGGSFATEMTMPKTSMNEDYNAILRKHEVRRARKVSSMKTIAQSQSMNRPSHPHLR